MVITAVQLTVTDLRVASDFFGEVLQLPVQDAGDVRTVVIGSSRLHFTEGPASGGVHHLAFDIPPSSFDAHRDWLRDRCPLLSNADGVTEFEGPANWNSRSVYVEGPDRMVLELIARRERPRPADRIPQLVSISEVGVAVPDVDATVAALGSAGLPVFGASAPEFAPVGDHDGLIIVVRTGRAWLPVFDVTAGVLPVRIEIRSSDPTAEPRRPVRLNDRAVLTFR